MDACMPIGNDTLVLRNGYRATIAPITPRSRPLIEAALLRMSPESTRRRFFTPRYRLSDRELDFLTSPDGVNHYAIGVRGVGSDGTVEGIAAARFVRLAEDPNTAEIAIAVIDPFHRLAIGKTLIRRLVAAAAARGIARLRALLLPDNAPAIALVRKYAPPARMSYDGDLLRADIRVDQGALRYAA